MVRTPASKEMSVRLPFTSQDVITVVTADLNQHGDDRFAIKTLIFVRSSSPLHTRAHNL